MWIFHIFQIMTSAGDGKSNKVNCLRQFTYQVAIGCAQCVIILPFVNSLCILGPELVSQCVDLVLVVIGHLQVLALERFFQHLVHLVQGIIAQGNHLVEMLLLSV